MTRALRFGTGYKYYSPSCYALVGGQASIIYAFNHAKDPAYIYAVSSGDSNYDTSTSPMLDQGIN